jgi:secreted Zn-dependent insulinase-like peptidase
MQLFFSPLWRAGIFSSLVLGGCFSYFARADQVGVIQPSDLPVVISSELAAPDKVQLLPAAVSAPQRLEPQWPQPELSPNDSREVAYFVLNNQLPVLLISDPNAEKAAAAMDVYVGSGEDPLDRAGLAHFLEHMLFLGTQKYPDSKEYQDFIQKHGGSHNAFTTLSHTNYFFDIDAESLAGGLDRFAQFFISPLFNEEYVDRERNAVHSEFRANFSSPYRRQEDVIRQIVTPGHALSRFSTGNLDSLHNTEGELRKALVAFYHQYYSARNMRLVVVGRETISQLRAMVTPLFSAIVDFPVVIPPSYLSLFPEGLLPASVAIKPTTETRSVSYNFPVPKNNYWMKKPLSYISFILGHESQGSLAWLLKEQGWAESLSTGQGVGWREGDTFSVSIGLTPKGLKNIDTIDSLLFASIENLQKNGINAWRFEELKSLGEIDFNYKERSPAMMETSHLASKMQKIESPLLFAVDYRLSDFDLELIHNYANDLNKSNVLRIVTAPEVVADQQTSLYEVPYQLDKSYQPAKPSDLNEELYKGLIAKLALPEKNTFIPKNLSLVTGHQEKPERTMKSSRFNAWQVTDTQFNVPRATVRVRLKSALVESSIEQAARVKLLADAIEADLNPVTYQADMAGASFKVNATARGLDFEFSGYSDSLEPLLDFSLKKLMVYSKGQGVVADTGRLTSLQDALVRHYRNDKQQTPYLQLMGHLAATIYKPFWSSDATAEALEKIDPASLANFTKSLFEQSEVTVLIAGNVDAKQGKKLAKKLKNAFVVGRNFKPRTQSQVSQISGVKAIDVAADHQDNVALIYVQGKDNSFREQAAMALLAEHVSTPFYHMLRTQQQLGYIVFSSYYPLRETPGVVFVAQSPETNVRAIEQAMAGFFKAYQPDFETQFRVHQLALVGQLEEKPKNLAERVSRDWQSLNSEDITFDYNRRLIAEIKTFEPDSFAKWYRNFKTSLEENKLILYSQNARGPAENLFPLVEHINDYSDFKAKAPAILYP